MSLRENIASWRALAQNDKSMFAAMRRVPQRPPSAYEIAAYFVVPALLVAMGAMPSVALFFLPVTLPMLYLLFRRFGAALPLSCVIFYALFSLVFNFDLLTVVYSVALAFSLVGLIVAAQYKQCLLCMAIAAISAVVGMIAGMGVVRLAEGKPLGDVAEDYIAAEYDDPFIGYVARDYYESIEIPPDIVRIKPGETGYDAAVIEFFGEYVHDELDVYAPYLCVHFGGLLGLIGFFVSVVINRRTVGPYDGGVTEYEIGLGSRCMGGVRSTPQPIGSMRFPRAYLWAVLLPALVASIALDFVGGFDALSATVMHAFVTLPSAAACFALGAHIAALFGGKKRAVAVFVLVAAGACAAVFSPALLVFSLLGLCDIILNIRYWIDFLRSDD